MTTTGKPSSAAATAASSGLAATARRAIGMPQAASSAKASRGGRWPSAPGWASAVAIAAVVEREARRGLLRTPPPGGVAHELGERARGGLGETVDRWQMGGVLQPLVERLGRHHHRQHRLCRARGDGADGVEDVARIGEDRRHVDHQRGVDARVVEHRGERLLVLGDPGRSDHVDRIRERGGRGQERGESLPRRLGQLGHLEAEVDAGVGRHDAGAAGVGDDGDRGCPRAADSGRARGRRRRAPGSCRRAGRRTARERRRW